MSSTTNKAAAVSVVYYSHCPVALPRLLRAAVLRSLEVAAEVAERARQAVELIAVVSTPLPTESSAKWRQVLLPAPPNASLADLFMRLSVGAAVASAPLVCLAEHDVLYPPWYLAAARIPSAGTWLSSGDSLYVNARGYGHFDRCLLSTVRAYRPDLVRYAALRQEQLAHGEVLHCIEPGRHGEYGVLHWEDRPANSVPVLDIRWGGNFSGPRDYPPSNTFPGLPPHAQLWASLGLLDPAKN